MTRPAFMRGHGRLRSRTASAAHPTPAPETAAPLLCHPADAPRRPTDAAVLQLTSKIGRPRERPTGFEVLRVRTTISSFRDLCPVA